MSFGNVVTLKAGSQDLSLTVIEKGLHVFSISFTDKNGKKQEIIIGPEEPKDMVKERRFMHSIVGRYCNRLPDSTLTLPNGTTFHPLANGDPGTSLHGGPASTGWDQKIWDKVPVSSAKLFSEKEKAALGKKEEEGAGGVWGYVSEDGQAGYPGRVRAETAFFVEGGSGGQGELGAVVVIYRAALEEGEQTAVNITQHWAFNLEMSDEGRDGPCPVGDVKNHTFHLNSNKQLTLDPTTSLPTGTFTSPPVSGKNFSTPTKIAQNVDDYWLFERKEGETVRKGGVEGGGDVFEEMKSLTEVQAKLFSDKSGLSLNFTTNQPGVQCWTGTGGYDSQDSRRKIHGGKAEEGTGDGYKVPPALAMEFHSVYGAWMHDELKNVGWDTVLNKGEVYNNWVKMTIKQD